MSAERDEAELHDIRNAMTATSRDAELDRKQVEREAQQNFKKRDRLAVVMKEVLGTICNGTIGVGTLDALSLLLIPHEPMETMEGETSPADATTTGAYVLSGGRLASLTVADGVIAKKRFHIVHEVAKAAAMCKRGE